MTPNLALMVLMVFISMREADMVEVMALAAQPLVMVVQALR
jgi:hypothetical protein